MAASSDGIVASVNGQGSPTDAVETIKVTIGDTTGAQETVDFKGWDMGVRLRWSPDGSLLLIGYVGPGASSPPGYVVLIRP